MNAPHFSLVDQHGTVHTLSQYRGSWVVMYFYPKDDTPGCTKEACGFRDLSADFGRRKVVILGVSRDSVASHKKFAEKFHLSFPLLSDPSHETIAAYGAWGEKKFMGRTFAGVLRTTVVISPDGIIAKRYANVNPIFHPAEVLADIDAGKSRI